MPHTALCAWVPATHSLPSVFLNKQRCQLGLWAQCVLLLTSALASAKPEFPWLPPTPQAFSSILITTKHHLLTLKGQISMHACLWAYKGTQWSLNAIVNHVFSPSAQRSQPATPSQSQSLLSTVCLDPFLVSPAVSTAATLLPLWASILHPLRVSGATCQGKRGSSHLASGNGSLGPTNTVLLTAGGTTVTRLSCRQVGTSQGESPMLPAQCSLCLVPLSSGTGPQLPTQGTPNPATIP